MLRQQKSTDSDSNGEHEQVGSKGERAVKTVVELAEMDKRKLVKLAPNMNNTLKLEVVVLRDRGHLLHRGFHSRDRPE